MSAPDEELDPFTADLLDAMSRAIVVLPHDWLCDCPCHGPRHTTMCFVHINGDCCDQTWNQKAPPPKAGLFVRAWRRINRRK